MTDLFRVGATGFVWVIFTVFMFGLVSMASDASYYGDNVYYLLAMAITGALALFAYMLTSRIWRGRMASAPTQQANGQQAAAKASKAKRSQDDRLARLMEGLDEDQIIELESLLLAQDDSRQGERRGR